MVWNLNRICPFQKKHNYFLPLVDTWFNNSLDHLDPGLDGTDHWCFHCYHVGGECGQGLFYNLFYMADPVFWTALAAEAGAARPLGVMLDGCRWLHENSVRVRGFPTVPRPCGDFIEEGRCQEARMFCANLGFCFCWSFCFLLAVFGHGWLFFFLCVCVWPTLFFFFDFCTIQTSQPVGNAAWSNQEIVAYHKIIEGGGCSEYLPPKLKTFPSDEDENLYIGSTQPTYAIKEEEDKIGTCRCTIHCKIQDLNDLRLFSYQTRTTIIPNHILTSIPSSLLLSQSEKCVLSAFQLGYVPIRVGA